MSANVPKVKAAARMPWFYDLETFPNCFTATFISIKGELKQFTLYYYKAKDGTVTEINELGAMVALVNNNTMLIGYNNAEFDDLVLRHIILKLFTYRSTKEAVADIYKMSQYIIDNGRNKYNDDLIRNLFKMKVGFIGIDFMKIFALDKIYKSLKQVAINIKHPRIQDLPYHYTAIIQPDQVSEVLDYNKNDVDILVSMYNIKVLKERVLLGFNISARYGIFAMSAGDSKIADLLLNKFYSEYSGLKFHEFKDLRTERRGINIKDCISPKVAFTYPSLVELLTDMKNTYIVTSSDTDDKVSAYSNKFMIQNTHYTVGSGGLHSEDSPSELRAGNGIRIIDADVTSYYPFLLLINRIKPEHLQDCFFDIIQMIIDKRVEYKWEGDDVGAGSLKIVANSGGFGKMGFKYYWMYDRKAMVEVTYNGQLFLLMLIESLVFAGFEVISANTDGIVTKVPEERMALYVDVCTAWEKKMTLNLEYTEYDLYVRRDVNTYIARTIAESKDGITWKAKSGVKTKGLFDPDRAITGRPYLHKAFDMPVVSLALLKYYTEDIPIEETIRNHRDIYDFCKSQNIASKFTPEYHYIDNGKYKIKTLQKSVRYYISISGGSLYKVSEELGVKKLSALAAGVNTTIFNDFVDKPFEEYDINYSFYLNETRKLLNIISSGKKDKNKLKKHLNQRKLEF